MSIPPDVVKSEESLEKQIEVLLHYFNTHHDHNAALKIVKLESLIIERDSVKLEEIDAPSSQEKLLGSSEASGSNTPHNEEKGCYSVLFCTHTKDNPYSCSECSYTTSKKNDLIEHNLTHSGIKPFSCSECSFCTNHQNNLIRHRRTHSGIEPFSCKECSYSTKQKGNLIRHQLTHSGIRPFSCSKPLSCKDCSYKTINEYYLKQHQLTHSGTKPLNSSECAFTGLDGGDSERHHVTLFRSTNSDLLKELSDHKNHYYIADKKFYSCKDCLYRTAQEKYMKVHQLAHSSKHAFSCPKCTFKTLRKSSLDIHEQCHLSRYTTKE